MRIIAVNYININEDRKMTQCDTAELICALGRDQLR